VYRYTGIPGASGTEAQFDNEGNRIQAHGGQIQKIGKTYYWVGEDKTNGVYPIGVHLYSSMDLYNWRSEGIVLQTAPNAAAYDAKVTGPGSVFNNYTAKSIASDPDYQAIYGTDFSRFKNDKWQYNISSPADVASLLKFDLNTAGYVVIERPMAGTCSGTTLTARREATPQRTVTRRRAPVSRSRSAQTPPGPTSTLDRSASTHCIA